MRAINQIEEMALACKDLHSVHVSQTFGSDGLAASVAMVPTKRFHFSAIYCMLKNI